MELAALHVVDGELLPLVSALQAVLLETALPHQAARAAATDVHQLHVKGRLLLRRGLRSQRHFWVTSKTVVRASKGEALRSAKHSHVHSMLKHKLVLSAKARSIAIDNVQCNFRWLCKLGQQQMFGHDVYLWYDHEASSNVAVSIWLVDMDIYIH
eukprot:scaffold355415_cov24-Prasinocladus_malaysianus.AAC.1